MLSATSTQSPVARSLGFALGLLAALALLVCAIEIALFVHNGFDPLWVPALFPVAGLAYVASGIVAWWRRPSNSLGALISIGGFGWLVVALANTGIQPLQLPGIVLATIPLALVVHLLHAFPSGRLPTAASRRTVATGYAVALILQVPLYLFRPDASPNGVLAVGADPHLVTFATWVQRAAGVAVVAVTVRILIDRTRHARPTSQRLLLPLYLYGTLAVLAVPLLPDIAELGRAMRPTLVTGTQVGLLAGIPVVFAFAMMRGGFAPTSEVQELGSWLGAAEPGRPVLAKALARALGDSSTELAFWVPASKSYVDAEGIPVLLPTPDSGRGAVDIELNGRHVGAISYDAGLIAAASLVRSAGSVIAIAMDRERLTAELLASRHALQLSRSRIVEAADRERRRIAQDLHDGLQVQLVLLAIDAQRLAAPAGTPPELRAAAASLRAGIDAAAGQLRTLVHGVMPAPLIERGLCAATEDLVDRMPIPTHLELDVIDGTLTSAVESTAYFVVAEALANAVKHSMATQLEVRLTRKPDVLVIEIGDNGIGGATAGQGLGLGSAFDRIDALGGHIELRSPPGGGTQLIAELPCEL
jgi:signal transduction histidine kinase